MAVKIGTKWVGEGHPCFVIAEIGINHNGSLETAKKMIDAAVDAGADAVKFQKRTIDAIYTAEELSKPRESPFGVTYSDFKRGLEFGQKEYEFINDCCRKRGILWFASCWDEKSVDFIDRFNPICYKIASPFLTYKNFLLYNRSKGKPIILSTGMSTMEQVGKAVEALGKEDLIILQCVSTYPTVDEELNLKVIQTLQKEFSGVPIGYSCHGYGATMGVCAVALGACILERHVTLDVSMWGPDQPASLEFWKFKQMITNIRRFEIALGDGVKRDLKSEAPMKRFRKKTDF